MKKIGTVFMATLLILDGIFGETNIQAATFNQLEQKEEQNKVYSMETGDDAVESTASPVATEDAVDSTTSPVATDVASGGSVTTEEPGKGESDGDENQKGDGTLPPRQTDIPAAIEKPQNSTKPSASYMPTTIPEATVGPVVTKEPIDTPEATPEVPEESKNPVVTLAPNTTKMPISTKEPEKTMKPIQVTLSPTIKPNVTTGAGVTATQKPSDVTTDGSDHAPATTTYPNVDNSPANEVVYCSVHYKLNGGTNAAGNPSKVYASGASYQLLDPKKKGYSFEGWYLESSFKHRVYYVEPNGATSVTYYAKWKLVTVPKAKIASAKRLKNGKIRVKVGNHSGAAGYEYVYSLTPTMAKKFLVRSVKNPKDLTRLKKNTRYYIKVRCYKYDSWGRKIYGSYSKVVKCK